MNTLFAHVPLLSQITVSDSPMRICLFSEEPFILEIIEDTSLQTQPLDKSFGFLLSTIKRTIII